MAIGESIGTLFDLLALIEGCTREEAIEQWMASVFSELAQRGDD